MVCQYNLKVFFMFLPKPDHLGYKVISVFLRWKSAISCASFGERVAQWERKFINPDIWRSSRNRVLPENLDLTSQTPKMTPRSPIHSGTPLFVLVRPSKNSTFSDEQPRSPEGSDVVYFVKNVIVGLLCIE